MVWLKNGGKGVIFNTISVSDGISMGTQGMRLLTCFKRSDRRFYRKLLLKHSFLMVLLLLVGVIKIFPACGMAMLRINCPSVFVYGGTILPGKQKEKEIDIVSVFEAVGKYARDMISMEELEDIEKNAIPGPGSCAGMYTANTMATAMTALGLSLPESSVSARCFWRKDGGCLSGRGYSYGAF